MDVQKRDSDMSERKIIKPKSLTQLAFEKIRDGITAGRYPLGSPLYEKVLAEEFEISKTPVREALVQLQHDGLVVVVPHSGTFVFNLVDGEVTELCEVRLLLETNALHLAMKRQPSQLVSELTRITDEMTGALEAGDVETYRSLDNDFHRAFFDWSGNGYLTKCYQLIEAKIATLRVCLMTPLPEVVAPGMEEHIQITAALAEGATKRAITIVTAHIRRARDLMQRLNEVEPVSMEHVFDK